MEYDDTALIRATYSKFCSSEDGMDIFQFQKMASTIIKFSDVVADKKNRRKSGANSTILPEVLRAVFAYYDTRLKSLLSVEDVMVWWNDSNKLWLFSDKGGEIIVQAYDLFMRHSSVVKNSIRTLVPVVTPKTPRKNSNPEERKLTRVVSELPKEASKQLDYIPRNMSYSQFETLLENKNIPHDETTFDAHDANNDGMMNFYEFVRWLGWVK